MAPPSGRGMKSRLSRPTDARMMTLRRHSRSPQPAESARGMAASDWGGRIEAGEELGAGVASHQPVADLGQPIRVGDRRQHVGQASGGIGTEACRRHPRRAAGQAGSSPARADTAPATAHEGRRSIELRPAWPRDGVGRPACTGGPRPIGAEVARAPRRPRRPRRRPLLVRGVRYLSVKVGGRLLQVALHDSRTPQPEVPTQERSGCGRPAAHGVQVEHLHGLVAHGDGVDAAPRQIGDQVIRNAQ